MILVRAVDKRELPLFHTRTVTISCSAVMPILPSAPEVRVVFEVESTTPAGAIERTADRVQRATIVPPQKPVGTNVT